jgi:hypothetical protein
MNMKELTLGRKRRNENGERGEDGLGLPSPIYQGYYTFP